MYPPSSSRTALFGFLSALCLIPLASPANPAANPANQAVLATAQELEELGIDFCLVRVPVRDELYLSNDAPHDELRPTPHPTTVLADQSESWLVSQGVPVIDLGDHYRSEALQRELFADDNFHLCDTAVDPLVEILRTYLAQLDNWPDAAGGKVVFIGECFAETFADELEERDVIHDLDSLIKFSGGSQVHNHLFAFREDYLADADLVVWVQTDRHFTNPHFEPLHAHEAADDLTSKSVNAIADHVPILSQEEASKLNYPNALRATTFIDLDSGEKFVGVQYLVKNRRLELSRKIQREHRYRLSLIPLADFEAEHRDVARECLIDETEDFTLPRYWIHGWFDLSGNP